MDGFVEPEGAGPGALPSRVFISYSRQDFYLAELVYQSLRAQGADVWMDLHQLTFGDDWWDNVQQAIGQADTVVWLASKPSLRATSVVQQELALAAEMGKPVIALTVDLAGRAASAGTGARVVPVRHGLRRGVNAVLGRGAVPSGRRGWLVSPYVPASVYLSLFGLAATFGVLALYYLLQLWAPISEQQGTSDVFRFASSYDRSSLVNALFTSLFSLCMLVTALALHRRRWRLIYTGPMFLGAAVALSMYVILPDLLTNVGSFQGEGTDRVRTVGALARPLCLTAGLLGLVGVVLTFYCRSILLRSVPGSGSPLAYFNMLARAVPGVSSGFAMQVASSWDSEEEAARIWAGEEAWPQARSATYRVVADPRDEGLVGALRQALARAGWHESEDPANTFLMISGATDRRSPRLQPRAGTVPVLAAGVRLDRDDPLLRSHFLDFRRGELLIVQGMRERRKDAATDLVPTPADPSRFDAPGPIRRYAFHLRVSAAFLAILSLLEIAALVQTGWGWTSLMVLSGGAGVSWWLYVLLRDRLTGWGTVAIVHRVLSAIVLLILATLWLSERSETFKTVWSVVFLALLLVGQQIPRQELATYLPTHGPGTYGIGVVALDVRGLLLSPLTWFAPGPLVLLLDVRPLW